MSAPTLEQMRALANRTQHLTSYESELRAALRSAADEVERLRALMLDATVVYNTQISRGNGLARQVTELRAVIQNAPHDLTKQHAYHGLDMTLCRCWKSEVTADV